MQSLTRPIQDHLCTAQSSQPDYPDPIKRRLLHIEGWRQSRSGKWKNRVYSLVKVQWLLRVCVAELCSLVVRIRFQYRQVLRLEGVGVGPLAERDRNGVLQPCKRSQICIRDMKNFVASHPWATDFDRRLFRDAWMEGAKYSDRISDSDTQGKNK
jgi:hypothetical protein